MKNIQKTNKNCYCLGGGGVSPPLKALKKTLVETVLQTIVVDYNVYLSTSQCYLITLHLFVVTLQWQPTLSELQ